jgi:AraC-like DNA-binding protein
MSETKQAGHAWKYRHGSSQQGKAKKKKTRVLKMKAQFSFEEFYCSPLREERCYEVKEDSAGKPHVMENYVARNLPEVRSTGIWVMDEYINSLVAGQFDVAAFCEERGLRISDIDSMVFMLTGMRGIDFRQRYQLQVMNELLRYTTLTSAEVARRSGFGSAFNLYQITKREYGEAPVEHRKNIREPGDEGRYR